MWFLQAFVTGFAFALGLELALGLRYAIKVIKRGSKK